jgi:hypothetical protein
MNLVFFFKKKNSKKEKEIDSSLNTLEQYRYKEEKKKKTCAHRAFVCSFVHIRNILSKFYISVARKRAACSRTPKNKNLLKILKINFSYVFHNQLYLAYKSHKLQLVLDLLDLVHLIILVYQVEFVLLLLLDANLFLHQVMINILSHSILSTN